MMESSVESRLWLAVHLLYSNASQAFDVYQAVVMQSENSINAQDASAVFAKLCQVYDKIPAISTQMAFYEFEFEEIDQWKVIYKNSQKIQLIIFVGVLIFELKLNEIAVTLKLAPEKAQFLFQQIFKKLASGSQKLRFNESVEFKKQNDNKISYLFTYENLVDYCLGQLSPEDQEKVGIGLKIYPSLQIAREEYLRIISQIQNLKVQKQRSTTLTEKGDKKTQLKVVGSENVQAQAQNKSQNYWKYVVPISVFGLAFVTLYQTGLIFKKDQTVVIHEVAKNNQNQASPTTDTSRPNLAGVPPNFEAATSSVDVSQTVRATPTAASTDVQTAAATNSVPPQAKEAQVQPKPEATVVAASAPQAQGGLYRGTLMVADLKNLNEKIKLKLSNLGAVKAGEVELGWMKTGDMAYYHYTMPEKNIDELTQFLKESGRLFIKFEKHPRLIPAGSRRFIIEVKQSE